MRELCSSSSEGQLFYLQEWSSWTEFASHLFEREWPWNEHAVCEQSLGFHAEWWKNSILLVLTDVFLTVDLHRWMVVETSSREEERFNGKLGLGPQIFHICKSHVQILGARWNLPYWGPRILEWPMNLTNLALSARCMWTDTCFVCKEGKTAIIML